MDKKTDKPQTLHEQITDSKKSSFARYQDLVLGTSSIWYAVKYEFIMLFASWVPGALGILLRKLLYPTIIGSVGKNVIFGRSLTLRHGLKVRLGDNVVVDDNVTIDAKGSSDGCINVDDGTILSRYVVLSCKSGRILVGNSCTLGMNTLIHSMKGSKVELGNGVLVGAFCYFMGSGGYKTDNLELNFKLQGQVSKGGIRVEDNVWFGSNVQILDGVLVGSGSIIGTTSVVNMDIEDYDVVAGVPAKKLRSRKDS